MKEYLVKYCRTCRKRTKHKVIRHALPFAVRLILGIATAGFSEMIGQCYECECIKCGAIRDIST